MPKWAWILAIVIIVVGLAVSYLGLGRQADDKTRVLNLIADCTAAANRHDWGRVLRHVSDSYSDQTGLTKQALRGLALQASRSLKPYRISTSVQGVMVSDTHRASALVSVTLTEGGAVAGSYDVTVVFQKRPGWWRQITGRAWTIVSAEGWQGAVGAIEP